MVNTFIIIPPNERGYKDSANLLDSKRLLKQCLEASQILTTIKDTYKIATLLNIPRDDADIIAWMKRVGKIYKGLPYRYVMLNGQLRILESNIIELIKGDGYHLGKNTFIMGDTILIKEAPRKKLDFTGRYKRDNVIIREAGDYIIKLGWVNHPAVGMWVGYENSLAMYINDHLTVFQEKNNGKAMNIPREIVHEPVIHPWWITHTDKIILSHRAALLRKEIFRQEPSHYIFYDIFLNIPDEVCNSGYIWVTNLSPELKTQLITNIVSHSKIASPITNDAIDISHTSPAFIHHLKKSYSHKILTLNVLPSSS